MVGLQTYRRNEKRKNTETRANSERAGARQEAQLLRTMQRKKEKEVTDLYRDRVSHIPKEKSERASEDIAVPSVVIRKEEGT